MNTPMIRPAVTTEAADIAGLMRDGMSANVQRITILGSPLLHRWVAGQLESAGGDSFTVATVDGGVVGIMSSRVMGGTLVLNHLYTHPAFQRRGIARALLGEAARSKAETVAVDVFSESKVARSWYAALGFTVRYRRLWRECALPAAESGGPVSWQATGLEAADAAQARQGFSQFQLTTPRGEYAIGRLAHPLFRAVGAGILADREALAALAALDPRRALLYICAPDEMTADALEAGRIVEESERLELSRRNLAAALARRTD